MPFTKSRISYLLEAYSSRKATQEEEKELFDWLAKGIELPIKAHIKKLVTLYDSNELVPSVDWEHLYQRIAEEKNNQSRERKTIWIRWTVAAAVLLLLGTGYYFFIPDKIPKQMAVTQQSTTNDIAPPTGVNAVLTLSNGQKIILDDRGNGIVAMQGAVKLIKTADGQIAYKGISNDIEYNNLNNPRGSKVISLTLADGSKVWLNSESTLKYPTAFVGKERKVHVTGEAYFEVAKNAAMPFKVEAESMEVEVLGTHFNINSYDDESSARTTLLEGRVKINHGNITNFLRPGQQAKLNRDGKIKIINDADVDEAIAWKDDKFQFDRADIHDVMKQIARWYDVSVDYKGTVSSHFGGTISREVNLSQALKMLELTGELKFEIEGKHVMVVP